MARLVQNARDITDRSKTRIVDESFSVRFLKNLMKPSSLSWSKWSDLGHLQLNLPSCRSGRSAFSLAIVGAIGEVRRESPCVDS